MCGGGWRGSLFSSGCGGGWFMPVHTEHYETHSTRSEYTIAKEELQKMFAKGEISSEEYNESMERLRRGTFDLEDLNALRRSSNSKKEFVLEKNNSKTSQEFLKLENRKRELEKIKGEMLNTLKNLKEAITELRKKAQYEESLSKEFIDYDEASTRKHIEKRQDLAEQLINLQTQEKEVLQNIEQLEELESRLKTKMTSEKVTLQRKKLEKFEEVLHDL